LRRSNYAASTNEIVNRFPTAKSARSMWSRREPWLRSRRRSTCGRWQSTRRASSAFPTPAARICRYNFNLRLSKRRECNRPSPASPARFGDRLSILDHARQVSLNRIHGAGERCLVIVSVGMDVWEIGERNKSFRPFAGQAYRILHHRNLTSGQWPSLFRSPCQFAILAVHGEHRFFVAETNQQMTALTRTETASLFLEPSFQLAACHSEV